MQVNGTQQSALLTHVWPPSEQHRQNVVVASFTQIFGEGHVPAHAGRLAFAHNGNVVVVVRKHESQRNEREQSPLH
jgi:hypothetical protein